MNDKGCVPVRILNVADTTTRIKEGEVIGSCQLVSAITSVNASEKEQISMKPTVDKLPELVQEMLKSSELNAGQYKQAAELITEFSDIFSAKEDGHDSTNMVTHRINTQNAKPIQQAPRRP